MKRLLFSILIAAAASLAMPAAIVCATEDNYYITDSTDTTDDYIPDDDILPDPEQPDEFEDEFSQDDFVQDNFDDVLETPDFPTISGNDISDLPDYSSELADLYALVSELYDFQVMTAYSPAEGTIPEPYLSYVKACLSWCSPHDNYVAFVSQYYYNTRYYSYYVVAIGDITYNGSVFSGSGIDVYTFYPSITGYTSTNYSHQLQSTFSYNPAGYLCFTDLTSNYPDLRGQQTKYTFTLLCLAVLAIIFYTVTKFGFGNVHLRRRSRRL